ncbi:MAG: hypothetical protein GWO24_28780, partial [Akkermansiaceae bacterium]|nr:hypothetical protein [Akkermansiaceae bacterium]
MKVVLRFYDVTAGHYPGRLGECDGYLTTGASHSVEDEEPWIARFAGFIRHLHQQQARLFGICFGHQMIAHALGGCVEQSRRGWGVGVHEVTVARREAWMNPDAS